MHKVPSRDLREDHVMSGRIFQNSVLQFKETTDRTIGVIDAEAPLSLAVS